MQGETHAGDLGLAERGNTDDVSLVAVARWHYVGVETQSSFTFEHGPSSALLMVGEKRPQACLGEPRPIRHPL